MGEVKIHYYTSTHAFSKSKCGVEYDKMKDHTSNPNLVTCSKCKKKIKK